MVIINRENRQKILQFFKLAIISGLIFIVILVVAIAMLGWIYQDNIKQHFLVQINKGLQTEVFIDDISVNLFRNFPLAAISLRNVTMHEPAPHGDRDTLMKASRIYFQFSLLDLLRKEYTVKQAEVRDGFVRMRLSKDGVNNWTIWNTTTDRDTPESDMAFQLNKLTFTRMEYHYHDLNGGHNLHFDIGEATVGGNFTRNNYLLQLRGDMMVREVVIDEAFLAGNSRMTFDFDADVQNNNLFTFSNGSFTLGSHAFLAAGNVDLSDEQAYTDIQISGNNIKLEDLIADLPPQYAKYFEGYRSTGNLYFDASINGHFSDLVKPFLKADFGISNGELYHRKAGLRFENLSFEASFDNGQRRNTSTTVLEVRNLKTILNEGAIQGDARIFNFDEPQLDVKLFSNINADEWQRFLQYEKIKEASGELMIDIEFKGRLDENKKFTAYHFMASQVRGAITSTNLDFRLKDDNIVYHNINADFRFNNNDVIVNEFKGNASTSDFRMKGYFRNVLPWLFLENERLFVDASLQSGNLNFNELLQHSTSESDTTYRLTLSDKIDFRLDAGVKKLAFRKFEAENVGGILSMRDQVFHAGDISLSAMEGTIRASGYINGKNDSYLIMGCEAAIENVDVNQLFYQMGNFGQESIEHENLGGRITADAQFVSRWSPELEIDWNALETTADIIVEDGELINYKPMLALSRFIRVGDLNQVKFSTLENQIRIKDQKIIIPDMQINSNAINIRLSGEHSFNNEINYRLQVLLSDLLARKNRESRNPQEEYGDIIDDGLGRTTLFLLVIGTIDDPVFRYDRKSLQKKLREDFRREGQNLREVFRTEFGVGRRDTFPDGTPVESTQRQKEQKEIEEREKGKFIIEWDD